MNPPPPHPPVSVTLLSQHDTEILLRETELLTGWERLYPPDKLPLEATNKTSGVQSAGHLNRRKLDATPPQAPAPTGTAAADENRSEDKLGGSSAGVGRGGGGVKDGRRRRKSASLESMIQ